MNEAYLQSLKDSDRFYGLYIAEVVNVISDPKKGKVQIKLPWMNHKSDSITEYPWAEVSASPFGGDKKTSGEFGVPYKGSFVYVMFLFGDPDKPIVIGTVKGDDDGTAEFKGDDASHDINKIREDSKYNDKEPSPTVGKYPYIKSIEGANYSFILDDTQGAPQIKAQIADGSYFEITSQGIHSRSRGVGKFFYDKEFYLISKSDMAIETEGAYSLKVAGEATIDIGSTLVTNIAGDYTLKPKSFTIDSDVTITGKLKVAKKITTDDDVVTGSVSLNEHLHTSSSPGNPSTKPI